jgi:hypothetical protein
MSEQQTCLGHENGFRHLEGFGDQHDLGFKYEEVESEALAEPTLALYISMKDLRFGNSRPITLHYGLTRSEFANKHSACDADRKELLRRALRRLNADLQLLQGGMKPPCIDRVAIV